MAKGSQLAQLKASISQKKDGSGSGKKRKRGGEASGKKEQSVNPFDLKVTKPKHDVGGRKIKGQIGKPTLKNQTGIEQVRATSFFGIM
jgi:nucleolar protein 14